MLISGLFAPASLIASGFRWLRRRRAALRLSHRNGDARGYSNAGTKFYIAIFFHRAREVVELFSIGQMSAAANCTGGDEKHHADTFSSVNRARLLVHERFDKLRAFLALIVSSNLDNIQYSFHGLSHLAALHRLPGRDQA